ncbi:MAG TPA: TadE family protein [Vicinamibacterales bacterium]
MARFRTERGTALIETALTLPLVLLLSVSIFEFGRAYQTWQVLTNAAREGARVSILPGATTSNVQARVTSYMQSGQLSNYGTASVVVNRSATLSYGSGTASASIVTVNYPFQFIVLQPVARLLVPGSSLGAPFTMTASAEMRNEQ